MKLGFVMPGESPAIFGDALRRLNGAATYLYHDGVRYWYSTQPTVTKLAEDRAEQLKRDPDAVTRELGKRLRADLRSPGDFPRVHPFPQTGQDVPYDTPRLFRNTLVFLAVDQTRLQDLDEAARRYLAWDAILEDKETLNLSVHQVRQAETQKASADSAVSARIPEAYQWLLVPVQGSPQAAIEWQATRLSGRTRSQCALARSCAMTSSW